MDTEPKSAAQEAKAQAELSILDSLGNARIPRPYWSKEQSLTKHGILGNRLATRFASGEMAEMLRVGNGCFFVGEDAQVSSCFFLTCRAVLFSGLAVRLYSLPELQKIWCGPQDNMERGILEELDVVAVQGFYDGKFSKPFSDEVLFSLGWAFQRLIQEGKPLLIHSSQPVMQCAWWSTGMLSLLEQRTLSVTAEGVVS